MTLVMACWVLAMVSGLMWARPYTSVLTVMTLGVFVWRFPSVLTTGHGWLQAAVFGLAPWVMAVQRTRERAGLKQLHREEAVQMSQLSETARTVLSLQQSTQQMETQITEITDLYHVTKETSRALHLSELFAASLQIAPRFLNAQGLRLIDLSGPTPQVFRAAKTAPRSPDGEVVATAANTLLDFERVIVQQAVALGKPASATAQELACPLPPGISRVAWALLRREQQPVGVLVADELPEEQLKTLGIVANQLALQCSRVSLYQEVEALAVTDALTGLSVRGYFMERAREELARSKRHGLSCTLLLTDLDLFKQKNDTFGHLVGDVVLKEVARLLQGNLREVDLIARFGGEEFILLLIETGVEQGLPIAQRLRQLVEVHPIRAYDELVTQTISMGVTGFPEHGDRLEALIEQADRALYAAKRAGRNRVVLWSPHLESAPQVGSGFGAEGSGQLPTAQSPEP